MKRLPSRFIIHTYIHARAAQPTIPSWLCVPVLYQPEIILAAPPPPSQRDDVSRFSLFFFASLVYSSLGRVLLVVVDKVGMPCSSSSSAAALLPRLLVWRTRSLVGEEGVITMVMLLFLLVVVMAIPVPCSSRHGGSSSRIFRTSSITSNRYSRRSFLFEDLNWLGAGIVVNAVLSWWWWGCARGGMPGKKAEVNGKTVVARTVARPALRGDGGVVVVVAPDESRDRMLLLLLFSLSFSLPVLAEWWWLSLFLGLSWLLLFWTVMMNDEWCQCGVF